MKTFSLRSGTVSVVLLLLLPLLPLLFCSCVSYTYSFAPKEPGPMRMTLLDDSLASCSARPLIASSGAAYTEIRIERRGAREIIVRSLTSDLVHAGKRYSPGSTGQEIIAYNTLPHQIVWRDHSPSVATIAELDPEFRVLDEVDGRRQLQLDYHYGYLPRGTDEVLLKLTLVLRIDGREETLMRELPLTVESKAHWGTLRLGH